MLSPKTMRACPVPTTATSLAAPAERLQPETSNLVHKAPNAAAVARDGMVVQPFLQAASRTPCSPRDLRWFRPGVRCKAARSAFLLAESLSVTGSAIVEELVIARWKLYNQLDRHWIDQSLEDKPVSRDMITESKAHSRHSTCEFRCKRTCEILLIQNVIGFIAPGGFVPPCSALTTELCRLRA